MTVTLTHAMEENIQREIARGHFKTPAEVMEIALERLCAEEEVLAASKATLDSKLEESFAAEANGEWISGEDLEAELDAWRARI